MTLVTVEETVDGVGGEAEFALKRCRMFIHLLPSFLGNVRAGVLSILDRMLLRHSPALGGIPVSYSNEVCESATSAIAADFPQLHFFVRVNFVVFTPTVGCRLVGVVNKITVDHIGLLVHGTFNAAIGRDAIRDSYEFDAEQGAWSHKDYSKPTIGIGTRLGFIVQGLETTEKTLSIVGSMLPNDTGALAATPAAAAQVIPLVKPKPHKTKKTPKASSVKKPKKEPSKGAAKGPKAEGSKATKVAKAGKGAAATNGAVNKPSAVKPKAGKRKRADAPSTTPTKQGTTSATTPKAHKAAAATAQTPTPKKKKKRAKTSD
eukprot:m.283478 g.283478  ORF g.283478 m.283478 type:complete len:318 (-) comp19416_c0_seq3:27-980(-)